MIAAQRYCHNFRRRVDWFSVLIRSRLHNLGLRTANSKDRGLWRVDDRAEVGYAEHAEVANGESAALELVGLQLVFLRLHSQLLHLLRYRREAETIGVRDDRGHKTTRGSNGNTDVNVIIRANEAVHPRAVDLRNLGHSKGAGLDDEVVHRQLDSFFLEPLVQVRTCLHELVHRHGEGKVVMRNLSLGLHQPLRNGLPHVRERHILVFATRRSNHAGGRSHGLHSSGLGRSGGRG
mmetsp:Transcript_1482/g.2803  ORF Transcript_1482/g.2803 Transcript_1482/m.2803 type:complete len:235 (-) Transcript_1482:712-1416(-)